MKHILLYWSKLDPGPSLYGGVGGLMRGVCLVYPWVYSTRKLSVITTVLTHSVVRPIAHRVHTAWIDKVSPSPLLHLITDPSLAHRGIHVTSQIESMRFVRHSCRFMSCGLIVHAALVLAQADWQFCSVLLVHSLCHSFIFCCEVRSFYDCTGGCETCTALHDVDDEHGWVDSLLQEFFFRRFLRYSLRQAVIVYRFIDARSLGIFYYPFLF